MRFVFGECVLDTDRYELRRNGVVQRIEPQVFDVLALLVRDRDRVGPHGRFGVMRPRELR